MPQGKLAVVMAATMEDKEMLAAMVAAVEAAAPEEAYCCQPWSASRKSEQVSVTCRRPLFLETRTTQPKIKKEKMDGVDGRKS